jgi:hypothetical protein
MLAEKAVVSERRSDPIATPPVVAGEADTTVAGDTTPGLPSRYIDDETELLGQYAAVWQDFQQMRKSLMQRGMSEADVAVMQKAETHYANQLKKALRRHTLWPWLEQHPGTGGVHVARLIARIGDPRRFPGQQCSLGHTFAPTLALRSSEVVACPFVDITTGEVCPGELLPPRTTSGTRAMWRYFGLDGPRATAASGHRYDRIGKTAMLMPDGGIASQIVRQSIQPWETLYRSEKERLMVRGAEGTTESESFGGSAHLEGAEVAGSHESVGALGLRPFQIDNIAKKVAVKHFAADLLQEWKRRVVSATESERPAGPAPTLRSVA